MKTKHTPGPWGVSTNNALVFGAVRGAGLEPIGFIYGPACPEMTTVGLRALADANLAAAAPDLLEACEGLLGQFDQAHDALHVGRSPSAQQAIEVARAAIAKATEAT